jgi:hypothetical protein
MASKELNFKKVKGVWVDQKGNPVPKMLIPTLEQHAPPELPLPPVSDTSGKPASKKLEEAMTKLGKSIEILIKSINVVEKQTSSGTQKIKSPTVLGAMTRNIGDFFLGDKTKPENGRGLIKDLIGAVLPPTRLLFSAQDRKRAELEELKKNSVKKEEQTAIAEGAKLAAPDVETKIQSVKVTDIDNTVIEKLKAIFGLKDLQKPIDKTKGASGGGLGGGLLKLLGLEAVLASIKNIFKSIGGAIRSALRFATDAISNTFNKVKNFLFPKKGGTGITPGAAEKSSEEAMDVLREATGGAKKVGGGILSKAKGLGKSLLTKLPFGLGSKFAAQTAEEGLLKGLLKTGLRGVPVIGALAGGALSGAAEYAETGSLAKAGIVGLSSGIGGFLGEAGGAALGGLAGAPAAGVGAIPGAAVGSFVGGVGGSIVGENIGKNIADRLIRPANPAKIVPSSAAISRTQSMAAANRNIQNVKDKAALAKPPVVVNNNNISSPTNISQTTAMVGAPTVAPRASLDRVSY